MTSTRGNSFQIVSTRHKLTSRNWIKEKIMRCPKDFFITGEYFHIYNRSNDPLLLFREDNDFIWFLNKFKEKIKIYPASVFAYCLMPNHFHFLIRQDSMKPIYRIFNDSLSSYVRHYNFKYRRKGSLLEGHLQHININQDKYMVYLCQYIHFNPKKAGIVESLEDWKFSNYLECVAKRKEELFNNELLQIYFETSASYKAQIKEHENYVKEHQFSKLLLDN